MTDRRAGIAIGLVLGVVAIVLFVFVLSDDTVDAPAVDTPSAETGDASGGAGDEGDGADDADAVSGDDDGGSGSDGAGGADKPAKPKPPEPSIPTIEVVGGQPKGGVQTIETDKGAEVAFQIRSDVAEHVHVHGYDLFEDVGPGMTAKFRFTAEIDGIFEVELEDSAVPIIELRVNP